MSSETSWVDAAKVSDASGSRGAILRGGTALVQPFSTSLSDVQSAPAQPRKKSANDAAHVRQRMLDEARQEGYADGHSQGSIEGRAAGYQAGRDEAYAEWSTQHAERLREFAAELQQVRDQLGVTIDNWFAASEEELEALAVSIAKKLIGAQLQLDRSFVVETTKTALQQISEAGNVRIRVNPFDSVILNNARAELMSASANLRGIEIVDDTSIQGGCVIETDRGAVDATLDQRLTLLEGGLEEAA